MRALLRWFRVDEAAKSVKIGLFIGLPIAIAGIVLPLVLGDGGEAPAVGDLRTVGRVQTNLTSAIAALPDGSLIYADGARVRMIDAKGEDLTLFSVSAHAGNVIRDIAIGPHREIFFSDDSGRIGEYVDGQVRTLINAGIITQPRGLALSPTGRLYVADLLADRVLARGRDGSLVQVGQRITMPDDMAVDPAGDIYVSAEGDIYKLVGGELHRVFSLKSVIPKVRASQISVSFIAFAPNGDLIVVDELDCIIYRVAGGEASVVVGTGTCRASPDGTPASAATIAASWGVVVTPSYEGIFSEDGGLLRRVQLNR